MPRAKKSGDAREPKPPVACSSCGLFRVQQRRPSKSGLHYCSKPECQREKARAYYRDNLRTGSDEMAPAECSNCKAPFGKPRKVRSNDSPFGRWCSKRKCQEARRATEEAKRAEYGADERLRSRAELTDKFAAAVIAGEFVKCHRCGSNKTLPEFKHPTLVDGHFMWCAGGGAQGVPAALAPKVWPKEMHVYYNPPEDAR